MATSDPKQVAMAKAGREIDKRAQAYLMAGTVKTYSEGCQKVLKEDPALFDRYNGPDLAPIKRHTEARQGKPTRLSFNQQSWLDARHRTDLKRFAKLYPKHDKQALRWNLQAGNNLS